MIRLKLVFFLCAILLVACNEERTAVPLYEPKTVVVLVDFSKSVKQFHQEYREGIEKIVASLKEGDAIALQKIDQASLSSLGSGGVMESMELPEDKVEANNPTTRRQVQQERMKQLEVMRTELGQQVSAFLEQPTNAQWTEVMAGFQSAAKIFRQYDRKRSVLVVFSDMVEESSGYNFKKQPPTPARTLEILGAERSNHRMPDLTGVRIYVVAATGEDSKKYVELQEFWMAYAKAAGANIEAQNYSSALLTFRE